MCRGKKKRTKKQRTKNKTDAFLALPSKIQEAWAEIEASVPGQHLGPNNPVNKLFFDILPLNRVYWDVGREGWAPLQVSCA